MKLPFLSQKDAPKRTPSYVGDVGEPLGSTRDKAVVGFPMLFFALVLGFVLGTLVCGLLSLANALIGLVWSTGREAADVAWYSVVVCAAGGLICGLWTKHVYPAPAELKEVMGSVQKTGSYSMDSLPKGVVSFLLPLMFGGSIGPEAGLTGIIAALCTKVRALLSRAGVRAKSVEDLTAAATLTAVFGAPFLGAVAGAEQAMPDQDERTYRRPIKIVLYVTCAFGALAGMQAVSLIPGASSGLPRFGAIDASGTAYLWAVPCLLCGWLLAVLYFAATHITERLHVRAGTHTVALSVACGLALGCVALVLPNVLFSGEEQVREAMEAWSAGGVGQVAQAMSVSGIAGVSGAAILLLTGIAKVIATPACLSCGWRGGHFFPLIFAGASAGFGIAALSGADAMLCVTVVVSCLMGATMRKPLMAGALLLLCIPAGSMLWMALAVLIGSTFPVPFSSDDSIA